MVRALIVALVLCGGAGSVSAQEVDWEGAGGDLFGRATVATAPPGAATEAERPRLDPLSQPFHDAVAAAALTHGLDPKLLHALILTESAYRPNAVSPAGAGGLTQLMPETALELGVRNRFDPVENVRGGADYLARQLLRFGDVRLALAAYNAGPARVARLGRVPDFPETEAYVRTVIDCFLALTAGRPVSSARQCVAQGAEP